MTITIAPFTVGPHCDCNVPPIGYRKDEHIRKEHMPITYWRIYMDDKYVSYTSSKELAEKTKAWMEKWLKGKV
jgi:hypothetical protein